MRPPIDEADRDDARRWLAAAREPVVVDLLMGVFAEVAATVARERPLCEASGRCCKFESYGHRLYVTGLEAAFTIARLRDDLARDVTEQDVERARDAGGCCFQVEGLCSVHEIKPVACRTYFCDPSAESWMEPVTERLHERVRRLHELHSIPYRYAEWRSLLSVVLSAGASDDDR